MAELKRYHSVIPVFLLKETQQSVEKALEQDISVIRQKARTVAQHVIGLAINGEQARRFKASSLLT